MAIKKILNEALTTPMTRKEFLGQVGALLLAVIGVTSILHALGHSSSAGGGAASSSVSGGYGSSPYGGNVDG